MINNIAVLIPTIRQHRNGWSEMQILGDELRIARECMRYTQSEFASLIHVNRTTIGRIESGKQEITSSQLFAWASATGRSVSSFHEVVKWELKKNS